VEADEPKGVKYRYEGVGWDRQLDPIVLREREGMVLAGFSEFDFKNDGQLMNPRWLFGGYRAKLQAYSWASVKARRGDEFSRD
jgi:hypothetical protein